MSMLVPTLRIMILYLLMFSSDNNVNLRATGSKDVPRFLHGHAPEARSIHVDNLVPNQEPAVSET